MKRLLLSYFLFQNAAVIIKQVGLIVFKAMTGISYQWFPDEIVFEPHCFSNSLLLNLNTKDYGIKIKELPVVGKVDAILRLPNGQLEVGANHCGDNTVNEF
jgi:hypothetical protein